MSKKKKLCDLDKKLIEKKIDSLVKYVNDPNFVCRKCLRVANEYNFLCKAVLLKKNP